YQNTNKYLLNWLEEIEQDDNNSNKIKKQFFEADNIKQNHEFIQMICSQ
ncbi:12004_t:CDS:1, partial [Gigaspora margarita]